MDSQPLVAELEDNLYHRDTAENNNDHDADNSSTSSAEAGQLLDEQENNNNNNSSSHISNFHGGIGAFLQQSSSSPSALHQALQQQEQQQLQQTHSSSNNSLQTPKSVSDLPLHVLLRIYGYLPLNESLQGKFRLFCSTLSFSLPGKFYYLRLRFQITSKRAVKYTYCAKVLEPESKCMIFVMYCMLHCNKKNTPTPFGSSFLQWLLKNSLSVTHKIHSLKKICYWMQNFSNEQQRRQYANSNKHHYHGSSSSLPVQQHHHLRLSKILQHLSPEFQQQHCSREINNSTIEHAQCAAASNNKAPKQKSKFAAVTRFTNWSQIYSCAPRHVHHPESISDVLIIIREAAQAGEKIRVRLFVLLLYRC